MRDAMQLASVSLPNLRLTSNEQQMDFSLGGSMQVRFPDGVNTPSTSGDLLKLVTETHLWVARTGSCYLQLDVSIQGEPVSEENHIAKLAEWVRDCEIWSRVGLCLHAQERGAVESPGKMSFSIQHPDLSSTLVTQRDAFTAEFESVACHINICPKQDGPPEKKRSLKRKRVKQSTERSEAQQPSEVSADDEHLVDLTPDDQRAIDAFIQSLNMMPVQQAEPGRSGSISGSVEFSKRLKPLFGVALEILVLGSRKQYKGIVVVDYTRAECLTRLAPAVFNMPYLKTISDRTSLLPIIATSLARMKTAESPSLRQKAASFAARVTGVKCDHNDRVIRGIEKSTWDVLLSTIKIPSRPRKRGHDVNRVALDTEHRHGNGFYEPNIPVSVVEKEEGDDMAVMTSSVTDGETRNSVMRQSLFQQPNPSCLKSREHNLPEIHANNTAPLLGPHDSYAPAELNPTLNSLGMDNKPPMDGGKCEHPFTVDATAWDWNYDPWPMDIGSLTFDEWLCPGGSATELWGISYQEFGDVDVSFYKS